VSKLKHSKMHAVVAGYVQHVGSTHELLAAQPEPREPIVEAMLSMQAAIDGRGSVNDAYATAERASEEKCDPDLYALFLRIWIDIASRCDRDEEALAILRRAQSMVSEDTPAEISASLMLREGLLHGAMGNKAAREKCQKHALAMLAPDSPRRRMFVLTRAMFLCQMGRGADVQEEIAWLRTRIDEVFTPALISILQFLDCVETGRAREAQDHLANVLKDSRAAKHLPVGELPKWRVVAELMLDRWPTTRDELPEGACSEPKELTVAWARSTSYLLAGRAEEALSEARRAVALDPAHMFHVGFPSYTLIRAELAAGNGEAARRLIGRRRDTGYHCYLDDFFLSRAELLAGNEEAAAAHFAAVGESCHRYGAAARLDFELRLACELSPGNLVRLGSMAAKAAPSEAPAVLAAASHVPPPAGLQGIVGSSAITVRLREELAHLAKVDVPVLIVGETGTGKELAARALHESGPRSSLPFIAVNCGAISDNLLESELFGHERGAFTGAGGARKGIFEEAADGAVFLDEIGEIPPRLQVALLRVLEMGEIRPVGSSRTRRIRCRVLAATNARLEELVAEGRFRQDLLYRLRRMVINIPPLRERREDILPLADFFMTEGRADGRRPVMSSALRDELRVRDWPGNARQLRNTVERMRLLNSDKLSYELSDIEEDKPRIARRAPTPARAPDSGVFPVASAVPGKEEVAEILRKGKSGMRRIERLKELFREHGKLTRREVIEVLGVSPATATRDLKRLIAENFLEKVTPTPSPRSHYFRLRSS
jgi:DNA-binding NtrC family response regulator/tetratricopeptide (TPR) repeat protein